MRNQKILEKCYTITILLNFSALNDAFYSEICLFFLNYVPNCQILFFHYYEINTY